ncbi:FecR domain-containing protein [uncultured Draconibacterium sp.]|uniref:FecR family protein n=1 Tax=uncultured Draconibacterium sp. TaxID=1573823 RepID=UPI0032180246
MELLNEIRIAELAQKLKNNSLTELEFSELQKLIEDGYKHPQLDDLMKSHWLKLDNKTVDVSDEQVNYIHKKILFKLGAEKTGNTRTLNVNKWLQVFQKVAAVLIVPIIIASVFYNMYNRQGSQSWVEINSPEGARTEFHLPDGSSGWLNGGSKIKYDPEFLSTRQVELTGEAFFNITKRNGASFVVHTSDLDIKVLGTRFNVANYPGEELSEVILEEGKIEATIASTSDSRILAPGDKLELQRSNKTIKIDRVDTESYTAWKDGFLMLNDEALEQGAKRLERWYNVDIEIVDDELRDSRFKATFKDESLEEVIRLLALSTPIDYEILPRKTDENGVFLKKKIILKLKQ